MTSQTWWTRTKTDPAKLRAWLRDQYRGEVTAAGRIEALRDAFTIAETRAHRVLTTIAGQERAHAEWVGELLAARGEPVTVDRKQDRYWPAIRDVVADLQTGAAIGAHAEKMRLERIETIATDPTADADIRAVFARILPQERFHEQAFRALAGEIAMASTEAAHSLGRALLGLEP